MSYPQKGSMLDFFAPNIPLATTTAGVMREMDIGASSGDHGEYVCFRPCSVSQVAFALTGELAGGTSVAPTVIFKKRPTPLSATAESALGTLTIPDATAVGKVVYKNITPVDFAVGDSVEISWTIGTGTPTGIGVAYFVCDYDPEEPGNNSDMVASA